MNHAKLQLRDTIPARDEGRISRSLGNQVTATRASNEAIAPTADPIF